MSAPHPLPAEPLWPELDGPLPERLLPRLAYYARLAPSTHNSQPWRFVVGPAEIDVLGDESRWLPASDADRREFFISLGCAIEAVRIAADHAGHASEVSYFPVARNAVLAARIRIDAAGTCRPDAAPHWFGALLTRRTSHRRFSPAAAVTDAERRALYTAFESASVSLHFLGGGVTVQQLVALERSADLALLADPGYRGELARWIGEGQLGTSWLVAKLGELALARLPAGGGMAARVAEDDAARVQSAALAGLLSTRVDSWLAQLHVGEAYLRIALAAESMGLRMQPLSPVLEWPESRHELAKLAGLHERFPQHLFRIGHGEPEPGAHRRRPLGEVLLQA